ncbi:MAG: hypothetical protein LBG83_08605 [Oscillospiraceae bacterium]|nr:hypothetical protein [Oscillospiraceae bacterium]
MSKYYASGSGSAVAHIAKFDLEATNNEYFGNECVYYMPVANNGWGMYIAVQNRSEVRVRVHLRFYNVLQDDATVASSFNWLNSSHRRECPPSGTNYYNAYNAATATAPRFQVKSYSAINAPYASTDARYYSTASGSEGVELAPVGQAGDSVLLGWNLDGILYKTGTTDTVNNYSDTASDGTLDRAFRINYDIIATQID